MEADGIEHPGGGGVEAGGRGAFDRFAGKAFGDEASEAVQVDEVGEFKAVTEGSAGGENRVPQAQRANFYAEVNGASRAHFVGKNNTKPLRRKQLRIAGGVSAFVSSLLGELALQQFLKIFRHHGDVEFALIPSMVRSLKRIIIRASVFPYAFWHDFLTR